MKVVLYQIVNRELTNPQWIEVPDETKDFDSWLHSQGYGKDFTIRRGIVTEATPAEKEWFQKEHDRLKASGLIPSAHGVIIDKLKGKK